MGGNVLRIDSGKKEGNNKSKNKDPSIEKGIRKNLCQKEPLINNGENYPSLFTLFKIK